MWFSRCRQTVSGIQPNPSLWTPFWFIHSLGPTESEFLIIINSAIWTPCYYRLRISFVPVMTKVPFVFFCSPLLYEQCWSILMMKFNNNYCMGLLQLTLYWTASDVLLSLYYKVNDTCHKNHYYNRIIFWQKPKKMTFI